MRKPRKKGSLVVEFIVVLPVLVLLAWGCLQIMFFTNAQSVLHQAATDAARVVAIELRGHLGLITDVDDDTKAIIIDQIQTKVFNVTKYNALILLYRDRDYGYKSFAQVPIILDEGSCQEKLSPQGTSAICVETITDYTDANTTELHQAQEQVVVRIKAPFKLIGSFLPQLENLSAKGQGSAIKEITERSNYVPGI